jgi:hypothetical protein
MSLSFLSMGFMGWTIGFIALAFGGEIVFNMTFEDWFPQAHGNEPHVIETDANWGLDGHGIQAFIEVLQAQKDSLCAQKIQLEADLPRE